MVKFCIRIYHRRPLQAESPNARPEWLEQVWDLLDSDGTSLAPGDSAVPGRGPEELLHAVRRCT